MIKLPLCQPCATVLGLPFFSTTLSVQKNCQQPSSQHIRFCDIGSSLLLRPKSNTPEAWNFLSLHVAGIHSHPSPCLAGRSRHEHSIASPAGPVRHGTCRRHTMVDQSYHGPIPLLAAECRASIPDARVRWRNGPIRA